MKRILCIVGSMDAGGAETFLMKLYRSFDKTKYQMDFIVATTEKGTYDAEIESLGGIIYHVSPKSEGFIRNFTAIRQIVKENHYDIVLRTSQNSLSALELLAAKMGGANKRIFRSSNSNASATSSKQRIIHRMCRFMPILFSNIRIAPSTEAAEFMFGKHCISNGKATILKNAVDLDKYRFNLEDREALRRELGIENNFVIGHVGRFNEQKNHAFLIDIFSDIKKRKQDAKMLLVGDGELKSDIEKRVEDLNLKNDVLFLGVRNDVTCLLSAMDALVFPSLFEGMPNVVIESQAAGLPCYISDTITREAKITDFVTFIPLSFDSSRWAEIVSTDVSAYDRTDATLTLEREGYSIKSVLKEFLQIIGE